MRPFAILALLTLVLSQTTAVEFGEKAPSLAKVTWLKGTPVQFGPGLTVVEFWATWCPPCKTTIPRLTALQKKYKDKISIAGLTNEDAPTVQKFMAEMGDQMDYHVGLVDEVTYRTYLPTAVLPYAFVVDAAGTVLWDGFAEGVDEIVEQVLAGNFDARKANLISSAEFEVQRLLQVRPQNLQVLQLMQQKITLILSLDPVNALAVTMQIEVARATGDSQTIRETLTNLPLERTSAALANSLAFARATDENLLNRHLDVAFMLVDHALKLQPGHPGFLDTKARLYACLGLFDQAITVQQQAVSAQPDDAERVASLAYYRAAKKLAASLRVDAAAPGTTPAPAPVP